MTDEELLIWLRVEDTNLTDFAADRIEALIKERDAFEAKLAKALEALLWCSGSADFNEGGVAREGWLKVCAPLLTGESHE